MKRGTLAAVAAAVLCSAIPSPESQAGPSSAGSIPATADLCSGFQGAAYGLCNAACEASLEENSGSKGKSLDQVAGLFELLTGKKPPCLRSECVELAMSNCEGFEAQAIAEGWELRSRGTFEASSILCYSDPEEPILCQETYYTSVLDFFYRIECEGGVGFCWRFSIDFDPMHAIDQRQAYCEAGNHAQVVQWEVQVGSPQTFTEVCRSGAHIFWNADSR